MMMITVFDNGFAMAISWGGQERVFFPISSFSSKKNYTNPEAEVKGTLKSGMKISLTLTPKVKGPSVIQGVLLYRGPAVFLSIKL